MICNRLAELVKENANDVHYVRHEKMYAINTDGKWRRAMLEFRHLRTGLPTLTLIDEMGPVFTFMLDCSSSVRLITNEEICNEPFGVIKLKLYGLEPYEFNHEV